MNAKYFFIHLFLFICVISVGFASCRSIGFSGTGGTITDTVVLEHQREVARLEEQNRQLAERLDRYHSVIGASVGRLENIGERAAEVGGDIDDIISLFGQYQRGVEQLIADYNRLQNEVRGAEWTASCNRHYWGGDNSFQNRGVYFIREASSDSALAGYFALVLRGRKDEKLIFLLILAVGFAGFVSAIAARPSGAQSLDMVMTGYDVYEAIVTPDMVSSDMPLCIELSAGYLALPDFYMIDVPAGEPQRYPLIKPIVVKGQRAFILLKQGDYWLLI